MNSLEFKISKSNQDLVDDINENIENQMDWINMQKIKIAQIRKKYGHKPITDERLEILIFEPSANWLSS